MRDMPKNNFEVPHAESGGVALSQLSQNWLRNLTEKSETDAAAVVAKNSRQMRVEDSERDLVTNSVCLIQYVQNVAAKHDLYMPSELNVALDMALTKIRPKHENNNEAFAQVEQLVQQVVSFLADEMEDKE